MNSKESPEVWTPPELIVLVRSKPEEAVLTSCKTGSTSLGVGVYEYGCGWGNPYDCVANTSS
jgi:hypothetical protein